MKISEYIRFSLLCMLMSCMMFSCSEEIDFSEGIKEIPDGTLLINLAVPAPERVATRAASESDVHRLDVFIFSENGNALYQYFKFEDLSIVEEGSVSLALNASASDKPVIIYAVANVADLSETSSIEALRKHILEASVNIESGFPMIGYRSVNTANVTTTTVSLYRSVAKISALSSVEGTSVTGLHIYQASTKGYLGAPRNTEEAYKTFVVNSSPANAAPASTDFEDENTADYCYPSYGFSFKDNEGGAYVIVRVNRNNKVQYYRINLRYEEDGNLKYFDNDDKHIAANRNYEITITGFFTDGYDSPEEAANHPDCDQYLTYEIHDHASEILSMVTDGYNELGVTPNITLTSVTDEKTLVVKCFTPGKSISKDKIEFINVPGWITISEGTEHSHTNDYHAEWDPDSAGDQYEYKISITTGSRDYEDNIAEFQVKWNGLIRTVSVNYEAAFSLNQVCKVTLDIYEDGNEAKPFSQIMDYWTFVRGLGENKETKNGASLGAAATPQLWGIKPENMTGEKKRINGFHFPMPYGENHENNPWTYVYTVDFTNLMNLDDIKIKNTSIKDIEVEFAGDENIKNGTVKWTYTAGEISGKLTFDQSLLSDKYEYLGGTITFTVNYQDNSSSEIIASLYHTGFFHYEGDSKYVPADDRGYYYYEVIGMADDHWLDRNICAKSNKSYIDTEGANADEGREAGGIHYSIIDDTNGPQDYQAPNWDFHMVPPGYHIPNTTEWDDLRLHENFVTVSTTINKTVYMSTYYKTGNSKIGNIYFQKARFRNEKNLYTKYGVQYNVQPNAGDAGAAYYWSISLAPAMEKEHMGNWLRALYLNGSSSTYNNASITDHRMPVRCKAGNFSEAKTISEHYISFNVHEVTHVYLFDRTNGTALYTFPGKAVGTTQSASQWQHFYCSTNQDPEGLLMLFVKLDGGTVTIYRKDDSGVTYGEEEWKSFVGTKEFSERFLTANYAWEVESGKYYDFCEKGQVRENNVLDDEPADCGTSGGGGDVGGGDNPGGGDDNNGYKQGANETGRGEWNMNDRPQDPEIIIWEGNHDLSWDDTRVNNNYWSQLKPGSKLRIYGSYTNASDNQVSLRRPSNGWPGLMGGSQDTYAYGGVNGYVEIELTEEMIQSIINNGILITGTGFTMRYVTIIPKDGLQEPEKPKLEDGDFHYENNSGGYSVGWSADQGFNELSSSKYDWSSVTVGSTLTIEFNDNGGPQIIIGGADGTAFRTYQPAGWNPQWPIPNGATSITITIDSALLNNIRQHNGLSIWGGNFSIKEVTLHVN